MGPYRRPSRTQKALRLDVIRYTHECVEACSLGADDAAEFEGHLAHCRHILPGVQHIIRKHRALGIPVVKNPERPGLKPGQLEFVEFP
jgi:hypothetical protein